MLVYILEQQWDGVFEGGLHCSGPPVASVLCSFVFLLPCLVFFFKSLLLMFLGGGGGQRGAAADVSAAVCGCVVLRHY